MTAAEVVPQLLDRQWMPTNPWSCPAGMLVCSSQVERDVWLEQRQTGLGASDVPAVFGVSNWSTPWDVWAEKTGRVHPEPETEPQRRGRILEDGVADLWAASLPADRPLRLKRAGMMRHRRHPWMLATVDRLSVCRDGRCVSEMKTGVDLDAWGTDSDPQIPLPYELQVQQQLAVTGRDHAHIVLLGPRFRIIERIAERDDELIAQMVAHLGPWWQQHIVDDVEPEATAGAADGLARLYGDPNPDAVCELPSDLWTLREEARRLAEQEKEIADARQRLLARAKQVAGNASVLKAAGDIVATWKPTRKIAGADADWRRANAELAAQYTTQQTVDVLDVDRMIADHPALIGDGQPLYRVRQFRFTSERKQNS